ncbi:MAG: DUF1295 domain-containing protein [Candidatus Lokiarchaeota archaeon]|nr:DUF1295 domain-containing protein [Candidatus Lokiarchaeota archaeon]
MQLKLNEKNKNGSHREAPFSHLIQGFSPVIFLIVWILDSFIFRVSTFLNAFVPLLIRITIFIACLSIALIIIYVSHNLLFKEHGPSEELITRGILRFIRHPLYFGILLLYLSFVFLSISLISLALFILISIIYNWMVNVEEKILENLFGKEYIDYKKQVPKWIPNPFKIHPRS